MKLNDKVVVKEPRGEIMGTVIDIEYVNTEHGKLPRRIVVVDVNGKHHEYLDTCNRFSFVETGWR